MPGDAHHAPPAAVDPADVGWRPGRKVFRTLYRDGELVGLVDTPEMAREICDAMNWRSHLTPDAAERRVRKARVVGVAVGFIVGMVAIKAAVAVAAVMSS